MSPTNVPDGLGSRGLASRLGEPTRAMQAGGRGDREYISVALRLTNDSMVEGQLVLPTTGDGIRLRPFDVLERGSDRLLRVVNARVRMRGRSYAVHEIAVSKASVMFMYELGDMAEELPAD